MTRKDFELIAQELRFQHKMLNYNSGTIQGNPGSSEATDTVYEMSCKLFAQTLQTADKTNKFDKTKFLKACGVA